MDYKEHEGHEGLVQPITKEYILDLQRKVKEYGEENEKQKRINSRLIHNYEYLDQLHDKVLLLLTEEQIHKLNKLVLRTEQ